MNQLMQVGWDILLVQSLVGTTVLLICASIAVRVFDAQSAALRHRIWTLSIIGAILFPGFAVLLPNYGPQWPDGSIARTDGRPNPGATSDETSNEFPINSRTPLMPMREAADGDESKSQVLGRFTSRESIAANRDPASDPIANRKEEFAMGTFLFALWLAGFIIGLLALIKSHGSAASLVRRAIPVTSPNTLGLAEQLRGSAGVRVAIRILVSCEVTVPLTFGCFRPVIVLPSGYGVWSTEKCRAVLAHELAHIRRRDVLSQRIAQLATVVYWCQPLIWLANWRMRVEREFACDDAVLQMGASPREYARHLLDVAAAISGHVRVPNCVVAIVGMGGLEHRIKAILCPCAKREPVGVRAGKALNGAVLAIVSVLCLISPSARSDVDHEEKAIVAVGDSPTALSNHSPDARRGNSLVNTRAVTVADDHSAVAEHYSGPQIVLRFPPDRAMGVIYVQDQGNDIRQEPQKWAHARGDVHVPIGKKIRLDISAAGRHDLSPLRQLSPSSLEMLSVREAELDEEALKSIGHLNGLKSLRLYCCRIEDRGTRHFAELSELEALDLSGSWTSDATLAHLGPLKNLCELNLGWSKHITDRGVRHIARLESLRSLNLERTRVTDSGLALLKGLVSLRSLNLRSTRFVSGSGMENLAKLTNLRDLDLSCYPWDTKQPIGDAGLAHLVNLTELRRLVLSGTGLTDAGLVYLRPLSKLEELWLPSGPSEAGLKEIGSLTSLRKLGVSITMASDVGLSHLTDLENLEFLNLWCDESRVTDLAVPHLQQLRHLKILRLHGSGITDSGLEALANLQSIEELQLHGNGITFEGLRHLREFASLRELEFSELKGRSGTLRHLQRIPQLRSLQIGKSPQLGVDGVGTGAADEGLAYLSEMTDLERLSLSSLTVTDEGIKHVAGFKSLKMLDLANSRNTFSDAGLESLADLSSLEVLIIGGSITDRGLVHLSRLDSLQKSIVWGTISEGAMEKLSESLPSINKANSLPRPRT